MFTVIIPSRYSSTRLPGKPLAMIADKPMIQHVYERAQQSDAAKVVVATDDQRIVDAVKAFGGEVCMTATTHVSGTDRIHEVSRIYGLADDDIVVNVQGDEPLIPPSVINQVADNLYQHSNAVAATLSELIDDIEDYRNPNIVKVVADNNGYALYFSRATIPFYRDGKPFVIGSAIDNAIGSTTYADEDEKISGDNLSPQRHIGIYAYRVSLLNQFVKWPVAALEAVECLEQLRILANGGKIHISEAIETVPGGIDTLEDLERINLLLREP